MSDNKLSHALLSVESRYAKPFTSFTGTTSDFKNLCERYLNSVQLCQQASVSLKLIETRNMELVVENKQLKELLLKVLEKKLIGELDIEI